MKQLNLVIVITTLAFVAATLMSCDDKMKELIDTKWTLEQLTTEHGQDLYPTEFYSVQISEGNLAVKLDVNTCRTTYEVIGKNKIKIKSGMMCTRMCCDSPMGESFRDKLAGEFEVSLEENKLILTGKDTFYFRKWSKNDVKREETEDYIKIKRTGCFGTCPIYEMTIFADGSALYTGKRFVEVTGKQSHEFDRTRIEAILERAERIDFRSLQATYDNPSISDMESVYIEHNGTTVKVRYKVDVPEPLLKLIADVHQCAVDAGWIE